MTRKELLVGIFVILAIVGVAIGVKKAKKTPLLPLTLPSPSVVEQIQKTFNVTIPTDVEKTDLTKVGDMEGVGIATRKWQNGEFTLTILADLPDPAAGELYQAWLQKDGGEKIFLGNLRIAKGGYLLDFESTTNYPDYKKVIVATQKANILEGSF